MLPDDAEAGWDLVAVSAAATCPSGLLATIGYRRARRDLVPEARYRLVIDETTV